ncbi:MAG: hypothetical protein HYS13_18760 [Planctomycetia bacterium]|nr:hypothetical protein [Planctomycetia bacterium]
MQSLGRWLQIAALTLPPIAVLMNLLPAGPGGETMLNKPGQLLLVLAFSVLLFWIGRMAEGYAQKR